MKIWSLQALRFWAALSVVVYHANSGISGMGHRVGLLGVEGVLFGRAGVDVFFVLSGVIIALTAKGLTAQDFIAKRARRILPLYGAFTVLYLLGGLMTGAAGLREVFTSLTLWPALDRMTLPVVPVAWTLCFEMLFYASAALVIWRPKLIWAVIGVFAAALAVRAGPVTDFLGNPLSLEFLLGVGLTRLPRWRPAMALIPVGVAAAWLLGPRGYPGTPDPADYLAGVMAWQRVLYLGAPATLVVWGTMQIEARRSLFTYLGDASYALYLVHAPVVLIVVWALCKFTVLPADVITVVAAAASVLLAWRIHELFEKPMLNWLRRPAAVPAAA